MGTHFVVVLGSRHVHLYDAVAIDPQTDVLLQCLVVELVLPRGHALAPLRFQQETKHGEDDGRILRLDQVRGEHEHLQVVWPAEEAEHDAVRESAGIGHGALPLPSVGTTEGVVER